MQIDEKTIKQALQAGERVTLECKMAKGEVPKLVWETYSAFANTIGGLILLEHKIELDEVDLALPVELNKKSQKTTQKTAQKIREMMKANSEISIEELATACGITRDGVNYHIRNLKKNNKIRRIGGDNGGHWEVVDDVSE